MNTSASNPPVLFLDFDGVTHPEPCCQEDVFCRLNLIEDVLLGFPTVDIVISSSWRDHYTLEYLRSFFCKSDEMATGLTAGDLDCLHPPGPRGG